MDAITILLLLAALVCFLMAAFGVASVGRVSLVALGLAFWVAVAFLAAVGVP